MLEQRYEMLTVLNRKINALGLFQSVLLKTNISSFGLKVFIFCAQMCMLELESLLNNNNLNLDSIQE